MGIGSGIFLMALGAILTFGVAVEPDWLDLDVVGWVLILSGATAVLLTLWLWQARRRRLTRLRYEERLAAVPPGDVAEIQPRTPPMPPGQLPP